MGAVRNAPATTRNGNATASDDTTNTGTSTTDAAR